MALQLGVDGIEIDVHRLQDGTIVAIHDPDVKRTTNGKGNLADLTLEELKALDAGSWFNRAYPEKARPEYVGLKVPTLEEIINLTQKSAAELYIEIKDPERYPPDLELSLLSIVCNNGVHQRTRFLSFNAPAIHRIKQHNPSMKTALIISNRGGNPIQKALQVMADEIAVRYNLATQALIDAAHKNRLSVSVWTVNDQADMQRMITWGVDGIISNYPDRLNLLLDRIS